MFPVADNAQSLEFLALYVYPLGSVLAAYLAHYVGRQFLFLSLELFFDLVLDRQAVAVPARHIEGLVALHVAGLDNNVFQNLVECMAHVNMAIGIRRTVVENIFSLGGIFLDQLGHKINIVPECKHFGFSLDKIGLHRELG